MHFYDLVLTVCLETILSFSLSDSKFASSLKNVHLILRIIFLKYYIFFTNCIVTPLHFKWKLLNRILLYYSILQ